MSVVLHPQKNFTVVRQIANHLDTDTNYVRAVIRNAYTDAIIETLDLTDKGSQRFSKNWRIPADPSGEGFYISIVTSVYSDSGYVTKNSNYGDEENTYLIEDKVITAHGGSGVDSRTVRRIVEEVIEKKFPPEEPKGEEEIDEPEPKEPMRWDEVLTAVKSLEKTLKPEKQEKIDYKPFNEGVKSILSAVKEKEVTKPTDIKPMLEAIRQLGVSHDLLILEMNEDVKKVLGGLYAEIGEKFPPIIKEQLASTTFKIAPSTATVDAPIQKKEPEEEEVPFNINDLAS